MVARIKCHYLCEVFIMRTQSNMSYCPPRKLTVPKEVEKEEKDAPSSSAPPEPREFPHWAAGSLADLLSESLSDYLRELASPSLQDKHFSTAERSDPHCACERKQRTLLPGCLDNFFPPSQTLFICNAWDKDYEQHWEEPFKRELSRHCNCGGHVKLSTLYSKSVNIPFIELKHGVKRWNERFLFYVFM